VIIALTAICLIAIAYQLVALTATTDHFLLPRGDVVPGPRPPVSILKPMYGADAHLYEALRSHALQEYSQFEILFGVRSLDDPAVPVIEQLCEEFPALDVRLIVATTQTPNGKVGTLIDLAAQARHSIFVVNDGDIIVPRRWLREVVGPLANLRIGVVTCLYRALGHTLPARFEALGIATDFAPSALVAPFVGISEFGLGSTLAFRRADLDAIGGFASIAPYLADDYQLGAQIHRLGRRNVMSRVVVETHLGAATWRDAWEHQVRWARTIRLSRAAYAGLPITHAMLWALVAAACGAWHLAISLFVLRMIVAIAAGWFALRSKDVLIFCWLIPFRDLWGTAVWAAGLFGNTVRWRDRVLTLDKLGRITAEKAGSGVRGPGSGGGNVKS
jgi:ceramide glucosyltransferase